MKRILVQFFGGVLTGVIILGVLGGIKYFISSPVSFPFTCDDGSHWQYDNLGKNYIYNDGTPAEKNVLVVACIPNEPN